jgi:sugar/nucleoside kinase (ribokinase family)
MNIFVLGTTSLDFTIRMSGTAAGRDNRVLTDTKTVADGIDLRPGGSAMNIRFAFEALATAFGERTTVFTCTKLGESGPKNPFKDIVLHALGDPKMGDESIIDIAFGTGNEVPANGILVFGKGNGKTGRNIQKSREDKSTDLGPDIEEQIERAVRRSDAVLLQSRFRKAGFIAAQVAQEYEIPVILDYSIQSQETDPIMQEIMRLSDYIVMPTEACLPGVPDPDQRNVFLRNFRLCREVLHSYRCEHTAVSDAGNPIYGLNQGKPFKIVLPDVQSVDSNGAGDVRDAALAFFILRGDDFVKALERASHVSSFSTTYHGRDWIPHLAEFLQKNPVFRNDAHSFVAHEPSPAVA